MSAPAARARRRARATLLATVTVVLAALLVPGPDAVAAPSATTAKPVSAPCADPTPGAVQCLTVLRAAAPTASPDVASTSAAGDDGTVRPNAPVPDGISPAQLQRIYGVAGLVPPAGTTVGIVVAYDAPDVESDLARFRATFGLPACTTANGCLRKVDQRGRTVPAGKSRTSTVAPVYGNAGWELETTLDTQAVSAMCPSCKILLVEADSTSLTAALGPAVVRAQTLGAAVISNSFAGGESEDMVTADQKYWSTLSVPVFAASGDHGWNNFDLAAGSAGYNTANYPATSPSVISVGGTSATVSGTTVTAESAWSDAGSGCSVRFARPAAQSAYFDAHDTRPDSACGDAGDTPMRAAADVSAMADPYAPGFPLYKAGGWSVAGGTSLSVQLVAALAAYAGPRGAQTPVPSVLYGLAAADAPTGLTDLTTGTNKPAGFGCGGERICTAGTGWDGPTGLGTPRGLGVFAPLLSLDPPSSVSGGSVSATGRNFLPGEQVTFTAAGQPAGTATVAADGTYGGVVTLPTGVSGTVTVTVRGATSGFTASLPLAVAPLTVTPPTQTVTRGAAAVLSLTGFGPGETVTATSDTGDGVGTVVASTVVATSGAGTLRWIPSTTAAANGTLRIVVSGTTSGRSVTVLVSLVATSGTVPNAPTVLSAVPTTAGGAVIGIKAAPSGPASTSVAVIGSDGTLAGRASVSAGNDAFVTVPALAAGTTVTYTAVAGNAVGDSVPSAASLPVTGSSESGAGDLAPVGPVRRYDSRIAGAGGPIGPGATRTLQIAGTSGVPADGVAAVVVSLTLLTPTKPTYLTLWPAGEDRPTVSNANVAGAGGYKASLAKVKLGANGAISLFNFTGSAGVILDVVGFYAAAPSGSATTPVFAHNQSYAATTPTRVVDTRQIANSPVRSGGSITVPIRNGVSGVRTGVPADATGVELIVQAVNTTTSGYLTVYPTGRAGGVPLVSNVQAAPGKPVATAVLATIGANGTITVFAQARTDVIVDVVGYYGASADGRFTPVSPRRYLDTRLAGGKLGPGATRSLAIAGAPARDGSVQVPASATSVSFSLTAVNNSASTYVTAWQAGTTRPLVTTLLPNPARGVFDNLGLAGIGTGGAISLFNIVGTIDLVVDVQGYYSTYGG